MKTIIQVFPAIKSGGLERGAMDNAKLVARQGYRSIIIAEIKDSVLADKLIVAGVEIINWPVGKKRLANARRMISKLRECFVSIKPTVVHARSRVPIWLCHFSLKGLGIHFVTSCHGVHDDGLWGLKKIYNRAIVLGDTVVFPSTWLLAHYQRRFSFSDKTVEIIPPGIDTEHFSADNVSLKKTQDLKAKLGIENDDKVIILPGRVTPWKGQRLFIEAIWQLHRNSKRAIKAFIIGSIENDAYYQSCLRLIHQCGFEDYIQFLPATYDLRPYYALCDVVVSSSIEPESFGRVVCEAMSMQRLVVATNLGGSSETVVDGDTGFLAEPNSNDFSRMIDKALNLSTQERSSSAVQSQQRTIRHYSLMSVEEEWMEIYQSEKLHSTISRAQ